VAAKLILKELRKALAGRRLVWFGTRGEDGEALLALPELEASFAVSAPMRSARLDGDSNVALEQISGARPDLDRHDIDLDASPAAREFRRRLLREVSSRCAVVSYRPTRLISAMAFSMTETMVMAGLFKDRQLAFEHKPWVETALAAKGVRTLGWRYVADEHRSRVKRMARSGPLVLRANSASGGVGNTQLDGGTSVDDLWPEGDDGFVGVAAFLEDAVPINFSGCVYGDGTVRLHPPSLQLIGIESCTSRTFGYCGNDFGAIARLDPDALAQLDRLGRAAAAWLHSERYLGAFGVDALLKDGCVYFTEINPRFQGSSALSAEIADSLDAPSLFLEHLAASLGIPPVGADLSLADWARNQPPLAHVVVHNTAAAPACHDPDRTAPFAPSASTTTQMLPPGGKALPGATLFRLVLRRPVTEDGFALDPETERAIAEARSHFSVAEAAAGTEAIGAAR
jgi:hypothetical protein